MAKNVVKENSVSRFMLEYRFVAARSLIFLSNSSDSAVLSFCCSYQTMHLSMHLSSISETAPQVGTSWISVSPSSSSQVSSFLSCVGLVMLLMISSSDNSWYPGSLLSESSQLLVICKAAIKFMNKHFTCLLVITLNSGHGLTSFSILMLHLWPTDYVMT